MNALRRSMPNLPMADDDEPALADLSLPDSASLVKHADGWYWMAAEGHQEFGPFDSREDALLDMNAAGEDVIEPGETLREAEEELGLADWVDPDSGQLAEQTWTRIEDH